MIAKLPDIDGIAQIATWLTDARLSEIELWSPDGGHIRISCSQMTQESLPTERQSVPNADHESSTIRAPFFGKLRLSPSTDRPQFSPLGSIAKKSEALAVLDIGTLRIPIFAPSHGTVSKVIASTKELVGFNDELLQFHQVSSTAWVK